MIGLDTSAIIDLFKGNAGIRNVLENSTEPVAATIMSYLELFFEINPENTEHTTEGRYYEEFFNLIAKKSTILNFVRLWMNWHWTLDKCV